MVFINFIQKKLLNLYLFLDLLRLQTKTPFDYKKGKRTQEKRLKKLVNKAYKVPFYKERFDKAGVKPSDIKHAEDLAKLPVLTKDELRAWMKEEDKNPKYKYWYRDKTSGSTGNPLMFLVSPREKAYNMANWLRVLMLSGYNPIFGKTMSPVSTHSESATKKTFLQRVGILRREFINNSAPEEETVKRINEYKPDFLYTNRSTFMKLALYVKNNNISIYRPKYICSTSEIVDEKARALFKEVFSDNFVDAYGSAETGALLTKLNDSEYFISNIDLFAFNIYDDDNRLADEGRIIITPLYFDELPLINYVLGDRVSSEVIDGVRYVKRIQGRLNDYIKHGDGTVTSYFEINKLLGECEEVTDIRLIQKSYSLIHVQCVYNSASKGRDKTDVERYLSCELNKKFNESKEFEFEWMDSIPQDKNDKIRVIVCEI